MPKILIVDDDPTVVSSTSDMLKSFSLMSLHRQTARPDSIWR